MKINTENYTAETIINDLKQNSIEEVLKKYNLTFKELLYIQSKKGLTGKGKKNPSYITKTKRKTFRVNKTIDGKIVNFGEYHTWKEAELIVSEMKKVYWNKGKLGMVKFLYGVCDVNE